MDFESICRQIVDEAGETLESLGQFGDGVRSSPQSPGVYLVGDDYLSVVYVGMAGKRSIRQRLMEYCAGNDMNGLAERAMDAALADPGWIRGRLALLEGGEAPASAREWMQAALTRNELRLATVICQSNEHARNVERELTRALKQRDLFWLRGIVHPPA